MEANITSLTREYRFKDGMTRATARIPKAKWDEHRELLCSLYQEMTVTDILAFMRAEHDFVANAGQLGHKLRQWGVYKYDSKNRPLDVAWPASGNYRTPEPIPVTSPDEIVQGQPVQCVLATDADIPVLSIPHSSPISDTDSRILQSDQAKTTTNTGMDFSQCVDNVKGAYRDATSLVDLIQEKKEDTESTSFPDGSLKGLRSSLVYGHSIIESHYMDDFKWLGKQYARGDSLACEKMESILTTFQSTILSNLQRVEYEVWPSLDYKTLRSASYNNTAMAVTYLRALSYRIFVAAAATENGVLPENNMPYAMVSDWMPETLAYPDGWPAGDYKSFRDWGQSSSAHESQPYDGRASSIVQAMPTVTEEPENEGMSDIDMDRSSTMSLAPSSLSGFSSLRSLARRIRFRQTGNSSSDRYSMDDLPSNVMKWNWSNRSLELFGQLSSRQSIASSQKTGSSRMSWRPETPATVEDDGMHPS